MNVSRLAFRALFYGVAAGLVAVFPAAVPPASAAPVSADSTLAGHWEGTVTVPGMELTVMVDLEDKGGAWSGTIDIPMQGAKGLPLDKFAVEGDRVTFAIAGVPGAPTFAGTWAGGEIKGNMAQSGMSFPFRLGREVVKGPNRPQEPKPPYPYRTEDVSVPDGDISLAGTLTLPEGKGPFPAVVLVSGSGPQDRDETVFAHRPFLILADRLTRTGVAVLRYDDRGAGKSTGDFKTATTQDFTTDALAAVSYLQGRSEIAKDHIGVLGHSEGGLVAPLAASKSKDVAFVVMIAGPGVPGDEIILAQTERIARADSSKEERIAQDLELTRRAFELLRTEKDETKLRQELHKIGAQQVALMSAEERRAVGDSLETIVDRQIAPLMSPWFRYFLTYDPRPTLAKVKVPVLALWGGLDLQVPPAQSLPEVRKALEKAGNKDVTLRELPGLNHLLQKATTGSPSEYMTIEETINEEALTAIAEWITARFAKKR